MSKKKKKCAPQVPPVTTNATPPDTGGVPPDPTHPHP